MSSVLVVEDDRTTRRALTDRLTESGYEVEPAEGVGVAKDLLEGTTFDAVLLDIHLKDGDGLDLLEELRGRMPQLPVIMVTAFRDSERAIQAMKAGAFDYVTKPFDLDALLDVLARAVRERAAVPTVATTGPSAALIGGSKAMLDVWKRIGRAAASRAPVLITGESGTGKELVARAIHEHSHADRPFVAVNVAALPPSLVESELFGHEKGAFTGATTRREGRFELAQDGTLFLDEIADLELPLQTKLLRVLEDGGYERVGGATRLASDARIISATSKAVDPSSGPLREDLYYRLVVLRIDVPPLRERLDDVPLLVQEFLHQASDRPRGVSEGAMRLLMAQPWPGNVRQLRHALEKACVMSTADTLTEDDFELVEVGADTPQPTISPQSLDLRENLERVERDLIEAALERAGGNRSQAARLLGIRRALLYTRLHHFGLEDK